MQNKLVTGLTKYDFVAWSGFMIFAMSSVITPICLPEISKTINTSLSESGAIETARNIVVLFILLAAMILMKLMKKKFFIAHGNYLIALGLLFVSYSDSYFMLVISLMIMGLGGGLTEAFLNPIIVDIHPNKSARFLNLSNAFYPIGVMSSAIIFGELLTLGYSWRTIFRIASLVAFLVAILFNILNFPGSIPKNKSSLKSFTEILLNRKFWLFAAAIFFGGGIESALTFWGRSYVEEYLSDIPRAGALAVMIFAFSMAIGRLITAYFSTRFALRNILLTSIILGILVGVFLQYGSILTEFYILISLAGLATAAFWPTILAESKSKLKVNTTMLFILLACFGVIGFGITPWVMGIIGDNFSLRSSLIVVPIFFIILLIIFIFEDKISAVNNRD